MSNDSIGPLVAVVGQTASGKSSLSIDIAKLFNGEIVYADSWAVRREVNIGTAKPTQKELEQVPHHLIDVVGPCEDFTAAVFKRLANKAIQDILSRGKLPILTGGSGLYIDSVLFDYSFLPESSKDQRESLNSLGISDLLEVIRRSRISTEGIDVRNKRRLIRLIESGGSRPTRNILRERTLILGISVPSSELRQRIVERVDQMIQAGLMLEVRGLVDKYGWGCEALKGIGYREWRHYFDKQQSLEDTKDSIVRSTMGLAKKQQTWFKKNKRIDWISNLEDAVGLVTTFLNK